MRTNSKRPPRSNSPALVVSIVCSDKSKTQSLIGLFQKDNALSGTRYILHCEKNIAPQFSSHFKGKSYIQINQIDDLNFFTAQNSLLKMDVKSSLVLMCTDQYTFGDFSVYKLINFVNRTSDCSCAIPRVYENDGAIVHNAYNVKEVTKGPISNYKFYDSCRAVETTNSEFMLVKTSDFKKINGFDTSLKDASLIFGNFGKKMSKASKKVFIYPFAFAARSKDYQSTLPSGSGLGMTFASLKYNLFS